MAIEQARLEAFQGTVFGDASAAVHAALVYLGDRLGLWNAMAGAGALTSAALAARTGTNERYVREWLAAQAVSGYVAYDAHDETFTLSDEAAAVLADEDSAALSIGGVQALRSFWLDLPAVEAAFRNGGGVGWHERDPEYYEAQERFTRPLHRTFLTPILIPALDGVEARLRAGARVADVGCGGGVATILLAEAYPASTFVGFDGHDASIARARKAAADAGVADRVTFEVATADAFPGRYDLVAFLDCLHDMGDPVGAARHARSALTDDGVVMTLDPAGADDLAGNLANPFARFFYSVSTILCTPGALSQPGGQALGTLAGERRLRDVLTTAGFTRIRRVAEAECPIAITLEARP